MLGSGIDLDQVLGVEKTMFDVMKSIAGQLRSLWGCDGVFLLLLIGCLIFSGVAHAHHSYSRHYLSSGFITVEGEVTRFDFRNPHVFVYVDVTNEHGGVDTWEIESLSTNTLRRQGWSRDTFKPGDRITVHGSPARDDELAIFGRQFVMPDGTVQNVITDD